MKPVFALAALCLLLGACQTTQPTPAVQTFAAVPVPSPAAVKMRDVDFKVYNIADIEKLAAKHKGDKTFVIIALTPKGYQNLALNLNELERYIREQKRVTIYLKEVIDGRAKSGKPSQ